MGIFSSRTRRAIRRTSRGIVCPRCGNTQVGLGYVDRVKCVVLHTCDACGARWRDDLIDLADSELAARSRG